MLRYMFVSYFLTNVCVWVCGLSKKRSSRLNQPPPIKWALTWSFLTDTEEPGVFTVLTAASIRGIYFIYLFVLLTYNRRSGMAEQAAEWLNVWKGVRTAGRWTRKWGRTDRFSCVWVECVNNGRVSLFPTEKPDAVGARSAVFVCAPVRQGRRDAGGTAARRGAAALLRVFVRRSG